MSFTLLPAHGECTHSVRIMIVAMFSKLLPAVHDAWPECGRECITKHDPLGFALSSGSFYAADHRGHIKGPVGRLQDPSDPADFTPLTTLLHYLYLPLLPFTIIAMRSTAALFTVSALVSSALGATYNLKDKFVGEDFLTGFTHQAIADPTHGRV